MTKFRNNLEWLYPIDWWKDSDGINKEALKFWFADYYELEELFN